MKNIDFRYFINRASFKPCILKLSICFRKPCSPFPAKLVQPLSSPLVELYKVALALVQLFGPELLAAQRQECHVPVVSVHYWGFTSCCLESYSYLCLSISVISYAPFYLSAHSIFSLIPFYLSLYIPNTHTHTHTHTLR